MLRLTYSSFCFQDILGSTQTISHASYLVYPSTPCMCTDIYIYQTFIPKEPTGRKGNNSIKLEETKQNDVGGVLPGKVYLIDAEKERGYKTRTSASYHVILV